MLVPPKKEMEAPVRYVPFLLLFLAACAAPVTTSAPSVQSGPQPPVLIERFEPEYPAQLLQNKVSGVVRVEATIDKAGNIRDPRVISTPDSRLNEAALDAIRKWRFRPGTFNGEPIDVIFTMDVRFTAP